MSKVTMTIATMFKVTMSMVAMVTMSTSPLSLPLGLTKVGKHLSLSR